MAKKELVNFEKTLLQLKSFLSSPIVDDRDRAGIIQAFEFTFEQCWKAIQKISQANGVQVGSPKQAFSAAIQSGWIKASDEDQWLKMIEDRNLTSHTYKMEIAADILSRIQTNYVSMLDRLLVELASG